MKNLVGTTIHQYQILMKVRETSTRSLYKAFDSQAQRHVGLEVIKFKVAEPSALLEALKAQAKRIAELDHPNIALLLDSGLWEDALFLVYNFYPLRPLRRLFNRTYSWQESAREMVAITQAVALAHEKGLVHGFLNPASIILDENKNPILFDFGFEQIISKHVLTHLPGAWINPWGVEYSSPEQLAGKAVDARSDVYAMGMILNEWMTGNVLFLDSTALNTLQRRLRSATEVLNPSKDVSPAIQQLIQKCIAATPRDRYPSMQEVSVLLARSALDLSITKRMVRKPDTLMAQRLTKRRIPTVVILMLVVILAIGAIFISGSAPDFLRETPPVSPTSTVAAIQTQKSTPAVVATRTQPTTDFNLYLTPVLPPVNTTSYPLFQETPIASLPSIINPENARQTITISLWGIGNVNQQTVSPLGDHIALASSIGVFILDPINLKLQKYLDTRSQVSAVDFSPDGKLVAVGDQYGLITLWDTETWQELGTYSGHRLGILDLAFSPDGTHFASVALDNLLFRWQVGSTDTPASTAVTGVNCVTYSEDGKAIITGGDDFKLNVWQADTVALLRSITHSAKVIDVAAVPESTLVAVGGSDRRVTLVDIESGDRSDPLNGLQFPLANLDTSADGKFVTAGDTNGGIAVWDRNGQLIWKSAIAVEGSVTSGRGLGNAHTVSYDPKGEKIVSVLRNGILRVFNASTGEVVLSNQALNVHTERMVLSHNGKYVIAQNNDGVLKIFDLPGSKLIYEIQGKLQAGDPFSPNDRYFAFASDATTVKVFTVSNGQEVYTFNGHQNLKAIQFVDEGKQLAAGNEQDMHLWSMASGQELKTRKNFGGNGCSVVYDLNDHPIFSITKFNYIVANDDYSDGLCRMQKLEWMKAFVIREQTGRAAFGGNSQLAVLDITRSGMLQIGMSGVNLHNVVSVALQPNGDLLAAAYDDHTIHFWSLSTREELMQLYGHDGEITDLQFTPDGKMLLSASTDGTIRLWGVP